MFKLFGQNLKQLRNNANLTQQQLADKLKVAPSTIGMYESDKRMPDTTLLSEIANLFSVSIDYLVGRGNKNSSNLFALKLKEERNKKKLSQRQLGEVIGVSQQTIGSWEAGRTEADQEYIKKLANFFEISTDSLLDNSTSLNSPKLNKKEKKDIAKDLENFKQELLESDELMFDGEPMSDESIQKILSALEIGMGMVREKNKAKYTPKKYKK